jgi:hypothetical protein
MLLSIANSRARNIESVRTQSLFPDNIQSSAAKIIEFIQEYYNYINTRGLPSSEIGSIITDKDIDVASNDYLDNIRDLIANNIPNSTSLDKVTLYKIIVKYYNTRGSEDSIIAFFKIFLNETVSIFYPKEYLFAPSSGRINWEPYDVPPLELSSAPVNGVPDTIIVTGSGLQSEGNSITFPTLTYAGLYNGRLAYTGTGALTNLLQQPYALYYDAQYSRWTLRGGVGNTPGYWYSVQNNGAARLTVNPIGADNSVLYTATTTDPNAETISVMYVVPGFQRGSAITAAYGNAGQIVVTPGTKARMVVQGAGFASVNGTYIYNGLVTLGGALTKQWKLDNGWPTTPGAPKATISFVGSIGSWAIYYNGVAYYISQVVSYASQPNPEAATYSTFGGSASPAPTVTPAISSAAQVIAAVNASPSASAYVTAYAAGSVTGAVAATEAANLAIDFLSSNSLQPATGQDAVWTPMFESTTGIPFLQLVNGDAAATQPTNGNLYARTGTWPNRNVYKCINDGSLPGHSIVWQLQSGPQWKYEDHKGFASDLYKIQDSTYWQNYSYDIQSNSDPATWRNAFLKFVHPAGLKLFTSLLLQMQSLNVWDSFISYRLTNLQDPYSWLNALNPTDTYQQHTPKYQPGWLSIADLEYIFTALFAEGTVSLSREVIMVFQFIMSSEYSQRQLVSQEYDLNGIKFRDPSRLGDGFLGSDRTISSMINSGLATVIVSSVIGGGAAGPVASVTILNAGVGYIVGTGKVTTGGSGSNFALNIAAVDTNGGITSISTPLNTAGFNYKVGDILTITNGAFNYLHSYAYKMLNVASVIRQGPNTSKATTSVVGTGCILSIDAVGAGGAITSLVTKPIVAGSGYTVGDVLTITGGTAGNLATATVTATVNGGSVTAVSILAAGLGYTKSNDTTQTELITNYPLV